jgi:hypothetical protein
VTRPRKLCTGPFVWQIRWEPIDADHYGETDQSELVIRVRPGLAPDFERETLMHEVLHACSTLSGA